MTAGSRSPARLHDGEVDIDTGLVRRLLAAQFPQYASMPVRRVDSTGTVNAIYRLGTGLSVRLPLLARFAADLEKEQRWLTQLAPHLSLRVPEPIALGVPSADYPLRWAIHRWLDGEPYADGLIADERLAATDLARFVLELRQVPPLPGAPRGGRRPLRKLDAETRATIQAAGDLIDADAALAVWDLALTAPAWTGTPVWIHADLLRPNLLVADGRLHAVIDFGAAGVGDPAADVIAAWSVFGPAGRAAYRDALSVDDGMWLRALGVALHQAAGIIPYYEHTNPRFAADAQRTISQILADARGAADR
ncbi:MAG TPA: aminoglycoside phosphotransferase family protein [Streptosporangiaceae bacterium]